MKSIIDQLRALNDLDVQLQTIRKDLQRLPKELAEKEEEPRLIKEQIERRVVEINKSRAEADSLDLDLKAGTEAMKKLSNQMNMLRTSKEFEAVRRQIDTQKISNNRNEEKALELLQEVDAKVKEVNELKTKLQETEKRLAEEKARVEKDVSELKTQEQDLAGRRQALAKNLPEKELGIYDRIVVSRGQAIAKISRGVCAACHMQLPPQVHNLVLIGKELVTCSSCGRILTSE